MELTPAQVDELAGDPAVVSVERDAPPTPDDERAGAVLAGQLPTTWPGTTARFPGLTPFDTTIDVTDSGLDDGSRPQRRLPCRRGVVATPAGSPTTSTTPATATRSTAPDTAPTSRRSRQATTPRPAARTRTAPASATDSAIAPLATLGVSKIFRCDGSGLNLSTGQVAAISAAAAGSGARHLEQLVGTRGRPGSAARTARAPAPTTRSCATPCPRSQGSSRWSRCSRPATTAPTAPGPLNAEASAKNVITVGASEGTRLGERLRRLRADHDAATTPARSRRSRRAGPRTTGG